MGTCASMSPRPVFVEGAGPLRVGASGLINQTSYTALQGLLLFVLRARATVQRQPSRQRHQGDCEAVGHKLLLTGGIPGIVGRCGGWWKGRFILWGKEILMALGH